MEHWARKHKQLTIMHEKSPTVMQNCRALDMAMHVDCSNILKSSRRENWQGWELLFLVDRHT